MRSEDFAICFADDDGPLLSSATRRHLFEAAEALTDQIDEDVERVVSSRQRDLMVNVGPL
jgi:hypothetical protein